MIASHAIGIIIAAICVLSVAPGVQVDVNLWAVKAMSGERIHVYYTYLDSEPAQLEITGDGEWAFLNVPAGCGVVVDGKLVNIPSCHTGTIEGVVLEAVTDIDVTITISEY